MLISINIISLFNHNCHNNHHNHKHKHFYILIGLWKVYLKSGKFSLTRENVRSYIGFLFSQLDSAINSGDKITIDNNFKIDILISRHQGKSNFPTFSEDQYKQKCLNHNCKLVFGKFVDMKLGKQMSQTKCGILNFSTLCPGSNCFFLTIAFGLLVKKLGGNFDIALETFLCKHRFNYDIFIASQLNPLKVRQLKQMDMWNALELISFEKMVHIEVFGETSNKPKLYSIYSTTNTPMPKTSASIYLSFKEHFTQNITHIDYLFDLGLLNYGKKGKTCYFCKKHFSYSWFPIHKCIFEKCFLCMRFLKDKNKNVSWSSNSFCEQDEHNIFVTCNNCQKVFQNQKCFQHHKTKVCQKYRFCSLCKCFFTSNSDHKCGEKFCRTCFKRHSKSDIFCKYSNDSLCNKKPSSKIFFADIHLDVKVGCPSLIVADIMQSNFDNLHGILFHQDLVCNIGDSQMYLANISNFKTGTDQIFKNFLDFLSDQANLVGTLQIICRFDLYNQLKYYLSDQQKNKIKTFKNCFTLGKLIFKVFQNFVDINDIKIAHALGKNPNLAVMPPHLSFTDKSTYQYLPQDFSAENQVFGENLELFDSIVSGKKHLIERIDQQPVNKICNSLIIFKTLNAVICLKKASHAFKLILPKDSACNLFYFNTLTEAGFSLYTYSLRERAIFAFYQTNLQQNIKTQAKLSLLCANCLIKPTQKFVFHKHFHL